MKKDPLRCCGEIMWGIEYGYKEPERYDGVSEWRCQKCGRRIGRWTMKELKEDEVEKRFGGK